MPNMPFSRLAQLAGANAEYINFPNIRGDIRQTRPDGTHSFAYFHGVVAGQTLQFRVNGTTITATFSNDGTGFALGANNIINTINSAISGAPEQGRAELADGAIAIVSTIRGGGGSVEVTGGTAAAAIGFDLTNGRTYYSTGGEAPSASVAGSSGGYNPYETSLLGIGEEFTRRNVNRTLLRVGQNLDVTHADLRRGVPGFSELGNVSCTVISGAPSYGTVVAPAAAKVFTGPSGFLSASSTAADLAGFFVIIDNVTRKPALSKVVAVVRGTPTAAPPYADSVGWAAADGGNVLGLPTLDKGSFPITGIERGKILKSSSGTFLSRLVAGDVIEISDATNTSEWDNNGIRWVVETVHSNTAITVRPLSHGELVEFGENHRDAQPIVSLSSKIEVGQSFGNMNVISGMFTNGVTLVVSPPFPAGADYSLAAAVRQDRRTSLGYERMMAFVEASRERYYEAVETPIRNAVLTDNLSFTGSGTATLTVAPFYIRFRGKPYRIPGITAAAGSFADGTYYAYFSNATGTVLYTSSASQAFQTYDPSSGGQYLFTISVGAGVVAVTSRDRPYEHREPAPLTVGVGGDFDTLASALEFVRTEATALDSGLGDTAGAYPHRELVVLSDQTLTASLAVWAPGIIIRGANKLVKINASSVTPSGGANGVFYLRSRGSFELKNITVQVSDNVIPLVYTALSHKDITLEDVRVINSVTHVIQSASTLEKVRITRCSSKFQTRLVAGSATSVLIEESSFEAYDTDSLVLISSSSSGAGTWLGGPVTMRYVQVTGIVSDTHCILNDTNPTGIKHLFLWCSFAVASGTISGSARAYRTGIRTANECLVERCTFGGPTDLFYGMAELTHPASSIAHCTSYATSSDNGDSPKQVVAEAHTIHDSFFLLPADAGLWAGGLRAHRVEKCYISGRTTCAVDLYVSYGLGQPSARENFISATSPDTAVVVAGIVTRRDRAVLHKNRVQVFPDTAAGYAVAAVGNNFPGLPVSGASTTNSSITGNDLTATLGIALLLGDSALLGGPIAAINDNTVSDNTLNALGTPSQAVVLRSATRTHFSHNRFRITGSDADSVAILSALSTGVYLLDNFFRASDASKDLLSFSATDHIFQDCTFLGTVTWLTSAGAINFHGCSISGNLTLPSNCSGKVHDVLVSGTLTAPSSSVEFSDSAFTGASSNHTLSGAAKVLGCRFVGTSIALVGGGLGANLQVTNTSFTGQVTCAGTVFGKCNFSSTVMSSGTSTGDFAIAESSVTGALSVTHAQGSLVLRHLQLGSSLTATADFPYLNLVDIQQPNGSLVVEDTSSLCIGTIDRYVMGSTSGTASIVTTGRSLTLKDCVFSNRLEMGTAAGTKQKGAVYFDSCSNLLGTNRAGMLFYGDGTTKPSLQMSKCRWISGDANDGTFGALDVRNVTDSLISGTHLELSTSSPVSAYAVYLSGLLATRFVGNFILKTSNASINDYKVIDLVDCLYGIIDENFIRVFSPADSHTHEAITIESGSNGNLVGYNRFLIATLTTFIKVVDNNTGSGTADTFFVPNTSTTNPSYNQ